MSSLLTPYLANIITTTNSESGPITRIMTTSSIKSVFLTFNIHSPKNRLELGEAANNIILFKGHIHTEFNPANLMKLKVTKRKGTYKPIYRVVCVMSTLCTVCMIWYHSVRCRDGTPADINSRGSPYVSCEKIFMLYRPEGNIFMPSKMDIGTAL